MERGENPMGAGKKGVLRVVFDKRIKLEFHGAKITSDGGLLLYRELDEALGLTELAEEGLEDPRTGKNTQHKLKPLLRRLGETSRGMRSDQPIKCNGCASITLRTTGPFTKIPSAVQSQKR